MSNEEVMNQMSYAAFRIFIGTKFAHWPSKFGKFQPRRFSNNSSGEGGGAGAGAAKVNALDGYKKGVNTVFKENFVGFLHLIAMGITLNVSIYAYNYQKKLKDFEAEYLTLKENDRLFVETFTDQSFLEILEKDVKASSSKAPIIAERILNKMGYVMKSKPVEERKVYNVPTDTPIQIGEDAADKKTRII